MTGRARPPWPPGLSPDEAASHWLVRLEEGFPRSHEADFDAWLASCPANAPAFARARRAWDMFEGAKDDAHLSALREAALAAAPGPRRGLWLGLGAGIAASILAVASFEFVPSPLPVSPREAVASKSSVGPNLGKAGTDGEFSTGKGERRSVRLVDGSSLILNTDSAVTVEYSPDRRFVKLLHGQVLFRVAKDHARPFVVQAAGRQVTALGTVFEVMLEPNRTKVMLVEGKVVVDDVGPRSPHATTIAPIILKPGQEFTASASLTPQLGRVDVERELRWREGFVEFDDVRLAEAAREINRYSRTQIVVHDAAVANLRISGIFRTGDPQRFGAIVAELLPVRSRVLSEDRIEIGLRAPQN